MDRSAGVTLDKASAENFPVAPFFLPAAWRGDLMAVYGFARLVDDVGDGDLADPAGAARLLGIDERPPGTPGDAPATTPSAQPGPPGPAETAFRLALLDGLERDLDRVFEAALHPGTAEAPRHPLLRPLVPLVDRHGLTPEPFRRLIEANRVDQTTARYATYQDLLGYCTLSADPVGRLVLSIAGVSTPERIELSDAVCTALQVVEHLQDVAEDLACGRIYLPAEDLARFGVTEEDLAAPSADGAVRELIAFEAARARTLLDRGAPLVGTVRGRLRLLLAGFTAGGYAALAAIEDAGYDVLAQQAKPDKRRLAAKAAAIFAKGR
ncbi:squalene synthase HpnC [Streptomyces sp. CB01881]|uniref:squalene synthase HpnC n=1 Tax=Streptomyces sp. CB01881 TaxID=2078691 RepID=UPI000CDCD031|nr:squalene synthase HpnC [Streptomyces sp. CB01881]AUY48772.1 squalene synthase HpnC [Streptomyces sp. CB01881]TYC77261.1 squalene synthase HpnC [Streptomyces sp. CB01881]